jgi:hypothetical protein
MCATAAGFGFAILSISSGVVALGATPAPAPPPGLTVQASVPTPAPTATPAPAPASQPAPKKVVIPPGYHVVQTGSDLFICNDADDKWVKAAAASVAPTTKPVIMPADLIKNLATHRAQLEQELNSDLALDDKKLAPAFLDGDLKSLLQTMDTLKPPIYHLVISFDRFRDLVANGWGEDRFHYNRITKDVSLSTSIPISLDGTSDDAVLPALIDDSASEADKKARLSQVLSETHAKIAQSISDQGPVRVKLKIQEFIWANAIKSLNLKADQDWFGAGASTVLSCKYLSELTGLPRDAITNNFTMQLPTNPLSVASVDPLHPMDVQHDLQPAAIPYYLDAYTRRSTLVVMTLVDPGQGRSDSNIPKVLVAIRKTPPADGPALVKLIQDTCGVNLLAHN